MDSIGPTATATDRFIFGLADRGPLFGMVFPAISTDGGRTWSLAGPCFYYAAAQGPSATSKIAATAPRWAIAWGRGGNFLKVTHDGGRHWLATDFPSGVRRVMVEERTLQLWSFGSPTPYLSHDYGLTWRLAGS